MSGAASVKVALETRLQAFPGVLPTQWENSSYTPVAGTPYQAANILWAEPLNPEMGRFYQEQGFMQITLRYPINKGGGDALRMAQSLRDWFYKGLSLAADDVTVTVNRTPSISAGQIDGDRYPLFIKVRFYANNSQ